MLKEIGFRIFNAIGVTRAYRAQKKNCVTVLNLHRISPERDFFFQPITPSHFDSLLNYLSKKYTVISFADINGLPTTPQKKSKPYVILSFDDGYYDFIEYALPLLTKYKLPSNHNIVNSCANANEIIWTHRLNNIFNHAREKDINLQFEADDPVPVALSVDRKNWTQFYYSVFQRLLNTPWKERLDWITGKEKELSTTVNCRMMNWDQVVECTKHGVEIGSHTYHHDVLSTVTDYNYLLDEVQRSKSEIEEKIKKPVTILALPNGQTNKDIQRACEQAGLSTILYVDDKVNEPERFHTGGVSLISRINIIDESPVEMFLRAELFHSKLRRYAR